MKDTIVYGTVVILLLLAFAVYTAEAAAGTEVTLRPGKINSFQCKSVTGKINIRTETPGEFSIVIEGVPDSWLEYPETVYVDDEKTVNYIINPQRPGTYYMSVIIDGPGGYFFDDEVMLWASSKETADLNQPEEADEFEGGFTGMFAFSEQQQSVLMVMAVVVAAVFAVFLARRTLRREEPYDNTMGLNF
jgi:hypothetical protein